jgi:magnesium-transporting ATPase (P-type)
VFDKTGTLTIGKPVVTKVIASLSEGDVNTKLSGSYALSWICISYEITFGTSCTLSYGSEVHC